MQPEPHVVVGGAAAAGQGRSVGARASQVEQCLAGREDQRRGSAGIVRRRRGQRTQTQRARQGGCRAIAAHPKQVGGSGRCRPGHGTLQVAGIVIAGQRGRRQRWADTPRVHRQHRVTSDKPASGQCHRAGHRTGPAEPHIFMNHRRTAPRQCRPIGRGLSGGEGRLGEPAQTRGCGAEVVGGLAERQAGCRQTGCQARGPLRKVLPGKRMHH
ncbi:MAG: hypothetical protein ACK5QX_01855 [bacterium]